MIVDILKAVEELTNGEHNWEPMPDSFHFGWNFPDLQCTKCKMIVEYVINKDLLPKKGCQRKLTQLEKTLVEHIRSGQDNIKDIKPIKPKYKIGQLVIATSSEKGLTKDYEYKISIVGSDSWGIEYLKVGIYRDGHQVWIEASNFILKEQ